MIHTLVGRSAPDFTAPAVLKTGQIEPNFQLSTAIKGKYAVLFFYPLDFTFVCPSELIALNNRIQDFQSREAEVIGISIDSHFTHKAWRETAIEKGGVGPIQYPLVADLNHQICQSFGIEHQDGIALRGVFILDKAGVVRIQHVHDLPIGRNIDELVRLIDALQFHEKHGEVCPAGWRKGAQGMQPTTEGVAAYLSEHADKL